MKVLIIEDEKSLSMVLKELLKCEGFLVDVALDGIEGLDNALSGIYDIIVLDINLPSMNGFEILTELRKQHIASSVLMLTAKSEIDDKVKGLQIGADDYLTKPFVTSEFIARVWALSRRNSKEYVPEIIKFSDIILNRAKHEIQKDDIKIKIPTKEFQVLELLILNHGGVLSKEQFIKKIWGYDTDVEYNSIEVYISFLRKKLEAIHSKLHIKTIRNFGYTLGEK